MWRAHVALRLASILLFGVFIWRPSLLLSGAESLHANYFVVMRLLVPLLVLLHVLFQATTTNISGVCRAMLHFIVGIPVCHMLAFLFGAPLYDSSELFVNTVLWSTAVSCVLTLGSLSGLNSDQWASIFDLLHSSPNAVPMVTQKQSTPLPQQQWTDFGFRKVHFYSVLLFVWASACVIPLDWEREWQVFPVCTTYGLFLGECISLPLTLANQCLATRAYADDLSETLDDRRKYRIRRKWD